MLPRAIAKPRGTQLPNPPPDLARNCFARYFFYARALSWPSFPVDLPRFCDSCVLRITLLNKVCSFGCEIEILEAWSGKTITAFICTAHYIICTCAQLAIISCIAAFCRLVITSFLWLQLAIPWHLLCFYWLAPCQPSSASVIFSSVRDLL